MCILIVMANGWSELTISFKEHRGGNRRKKKNHGHSNMERALVILPKRFRALVGIPAQYFGPTSLLYKKSHNYHGTS